MFLQVPENWLLGTNYSVNDVNRFELNEIVIIQRSDGRKTFASICSIDNANNEYECKVTDFLPLLFYFGGNSSLIHDLNLDCRGYRYLVNTKQEAYINILLRTDIGHLLVFGAGGA
jgi:hypothetical protein